MRVELMLLLCESSILPLNYKPYVFHVKFFVGMLGIEPR